MLLFVFFLGLPAARPSPSLIFKGQGGGAAAGCKAGARGQRSSGPAKARGSETAGAGGESCLSPIVTTIRITKHSFIH